MSETLIPEACPCGKELERGVCKRCGANFNYKHTTGRRKSPRPPNFFSRNLWGLSECRKTNHEFYRQYGDNTKGSVKYNAWVAKRVTRFLKCPYSVWKRFLFPATAVRNSSGHGGKIYLYREKDVENLKRKLYKDTAARGCPWRIR